MESAIVNNMTRILNILFWIIVIAYLFLAMGFVSDRRHGQICTTVDIAILDSLHSRFVTADDILRIVENRSYKLTGKRFDSINTQKIGQRMNGYAPVSRANVYKTINGALHIDIRQRTPIVRIINRYGESFYLDEYGELLRHSSRYCTHVLVANGHINLRPEQKNYNVHTTEVAAGKRNLMRELFDLANYIHEHPFWNAQIQQVYINENGDFELIPLVGAHVIVFGTFDNAENKFARLEALYRNGLNVKGWNTYDIINLKYEGQIVCTKR
jgi:cell division protein FtsQ